MVLKAAVQALKKADVLKAKVSVCSGDNGTSSNALLTDSGIWSAQQQLTSALHQVLVLDLDYALDKKVEQELWTLGFKNYIAALQTLSRDKKNPKRSESQALLSWCLESASGFYLTLLQELCEAFQLDLPFRRRSISYGDRTSEQPVIPPQRSSCLYICQYCLVHLGDIARYRNQRKQAETFYRHAILLSPNSGQPYNQLALLQASRGDRLSTVFYYVRSVSLAHPFPPAASNLTKTFEIALGEMTLTEPHTKLSVTEYVSAFLKLHGMLHLGCDLDKAEIYVKSLISALTALAATESFTSLRLVQMLAINLYTLNQATENFKDEELTNEEIKVRGFVLDLLAGSLNACLLPVYTLQPANLLEYRALPTIKLMMEWIRCHSKVLLDPVFLNRLQIWPSFCKLLNTIQSLIKDFEHKKYNQVPLPEDRDLQGFRPLEKVFNTLNFTLDDLRKETKPFNQLRAVRLLKIGSWLASHKVKDACVITSQPVKETKEIIFEPVCKQESPTKDLLKELEQLKIEQNSSSNESNEAAPKKHLKAHDKSRTLTGILKPQGSLERAREEREQAALLNGSASDSSLASTETGSLDVSSGVQSSNSTKSNVAVNYSVPKSGKKARQNVAMQAILKKVEENSKQVKFQTDDSENSKEKTAAVIKQNTINLKNNGGAEFAKKNSAGILSLKNQSGYPHLVNSDNKEKSENQTKHGAGHKQSMNADKPQPQPAAFSSQQNAALQNYVALPLNKTNFPQPNINFATVPFSNQAPANRNVGEFHSHQNSSGFNNFNQQNIQYPQQQQQQQNASPQSYPYNPVITNQSGFGVATPLNVNVPPPNVSMPPPNINVPPLSMQDFSSKSSPSQTFSTAAPNYSTFSPNVSNATQFNFSSANYTPIQLPPQSNNLKQPAPHFSPFQTYSAPQKTNFANYDLNVRKNNGAFQQRGFDANYVSSPPSLGVWNVGDKLPMPPSGWWPNNSTAKQEVPPRFQQLNATQFVGSQGDRDAAPLQWNAMQSSNTLPNLQLFIKQPTNQPNPNQGITARQKQLRENKKLSSIPKEMAGEQNSLGNVVESQPVSPPGYSLFNSSNWTPNLSNAMTSGPSVGTAEGAGTPLLGQQSLFSGPGPSPLERLLEQQKQMRGAPPPHGQGNT